MVRSEDYVKIAALIILGQITCVYLFMGNDGTVFMLIAIILAAISGTFIKVGLDMINVKKSPKIDNNKKKYTWNEVKMLYELKKQNKES